MMRNPTVLGSMKLVSFEAYLQREEGVFVKQWRAISVHFWLLDNECRLRVDR